MLNKLRIIVGLISAISIFGAANVSAQDETEQSTTGEERVLDTVTVTGVQNDAAMAAFQAGDYATAEVEFLDPLPGVTHREVAVVEDGAHAERFPDAELEGRIRADP